MAGQMLDHALSALARHDWDTAAAAAASWSSPDPQVEAGRLDAFAEAAWWLGRLDECVAAREASYRIFDEIGDRRRAGQAAVWLWEHHAIGARPAIAGAWLRRARRALGDGPDCAELGALMLREAEVAHGEGDFAGALDLTTRAIDLARRLRFPNIEAEGLQARGRVRIDVGDVAEGMRDLDEAMLFAVEGRLGPYSTGKVYCSLISACEELGDLARASEWTEATSRWSQRHPLAIFPGICRVIRAAILKQRGSFNEAEREAHRAIEELLHSHVGNAAAAWVEVGDIRRRLGDLGGAEAAFAHAQQLCEGECSELALLRLAQRRIDVARSIIERCVRRTPDGSHARARALASLAQIAIAADDLDAARDCVAELESITVKYGTANLQAALETVTGRLLLARGDGAAAADRLRSAAAMWRRLEVPYEAATCRTLLGQALRASGDEGGAAAEFAAAVDQFDQLGARVEQPVAKVEQLPCGLTGREVEVLRLLAMGLSNREMAERLYLSIKTISRHVSNVYLKINVNSRAGATAFAFEHDLIGPSR